MSLTKQGNTNLQSSIKVLLTLFVMLEQDYKALVYYSDNVEEDSPNRLKTNLPEKENIIDFAITEALWFQIIIKSCSFLDEWDKFLGVKNEQEHINRLILIKRTVAPARKAINSWKELRKFRNEITAHNFRGKDHRVTIDEISQYKCPQSIDEIYFLICFIQRMIAVLTHVFPNETQNIVNVTHANTLNISPISESRLRELRQYLLDIDEKLSESVFDIFRHDLLETLNDSLK